MRSAAIKLRAAQLGIDKIDVADAGGYVQFTDDAAVDPMAVVKLVQNEGRRYRMRGAHKLQFTAQTEDLEDGSEPARALTA